MGTNNENEKLKGRSKASKTREPEITENS